MPRRKNRKPLPGLILILKLRVFASKQSNGSVQGLAVEVMKKFAEYVQQTEGIKVTYEFKGKDRQTSKVSWMK